ncbi:MAG TPA: response regulator transcription factor [Actinomycetaceae bacterium]|nr:response regulator transcription factor [Actinomycetaceae bacterium]
MDDLRIVIVDDHPIVRAGVRSQLAAVDENLTVVGEAATVDEALAVLRRVECDVVLLDVHLPGGRGGGGAEVVRDAATSARFLALSVSEAAEDVVAVVRAGARGYVTKSIDGAGLADAIRRVAAGDAAFSPRLAGFVLDAFGAARHDVADRDDELDRLSERESEVMRMIARGYTYREVASSLFISIKTVETHVSAVLRKLQLSNRRELARWAVARRLV